MSVATSWAAARDRIAVDDAVEADQRRPAHMRQAQVVHIGHHRKFREYAVHGGAHIMEIRVEGQGVFRSARGDLPARCAFRCGLC